MNRNTTVLFAALNFFNTILYSQTGADKFFNNADLMTIGSYYYPEQWPREYWERDLKKLSDLGIEFTHFGEFAWALMEPEEGKFDFTWLDEAVSIAHKNGVKVIMCTPSPTPPVWLTKKHPEVLMVNAEGRTIIHGARQHASWSSDIYKQYVSKIVEALANHYGNDKRIWGWQLDNEPSHYGAYDYSESVLQAYRKWLEKKYQTIDVLNRTWGTSFWSLKYNSFADIPLPNPNQLVQQANPHAVLDFKRFSASEVNAFLTMQYNILKRHISPNQWVTTNLMPEHAPVDASTIKNLDFLTYTKYLIAGFDAGIGKDGFRVGSPSSIGFANDFFRSFNGTTGVMELQPGQVNWGRFNSQPLPGAVRMWIWHAFAGGNKFVCNYRFKQPLTGGEQYHYGIISTDGISVSTSGEEYIQVIKELNLIRNNFDKESARPRDYSARQAAILYSIDSRWEMDNQPQTDQWNYIDHLKRYYDALKQLGAPVDVITEEKDFAKYPVIVVPAFQLLDSALVDRWTEYVRKGGHLVLTVRTAQKNREAKLWQAKWAAPIYNLIGASVSFYDHLPDNVRGKILFKDESFTWNNWAEVLVPNEGTTVLASHGDQYYQGRAAVTYRNFGAGSVTYIGVDTDDGLLEKEVLSIVYEWAGIKTENYPYGVVVDWRDGFWVAVNYSPNTYQLPLASKVNVLVGSKELKTAGVTVWK